MSRRGKTLRAVRVLAERVEQLREDLQATLRAHVGLASSLGRLRESAERIEGRDPLIRRVKLRRARSLVLEEHAARSSVALRQAARLLDELLDGGP